MSRKRRLRFMIVALVLGLVGGLTGNATWSAFSATTANPGNTMSATTVTLSDNDAGAAVLSMSSGVPGATDSGCIQVTYSGAANAVVRMYGTTTGTGLDAYLDLVVTRGTVSSGAFDSCANFSADATDYLGSGAGVIYSGTLAAFADDFAGGILEPTTALAETWSTIEVHAYKLQWTLQDNNAAQGLTATQAFTWEARNLSGYAAAVNADSPVGYWRLGEASGTTATATTGSPNGTYAGSPTLGTAGTVNDTSAAVTFDAVNDTVNLGDNHGFTGTASSSVECWVKPTAATANVRRLVSKEAASANGGWDVELAATTNRVQFRRFASDMSFSQATGTTNLAAGTWYHVVATYDGTNMRIYVNGTLEHTAASSKSVGTSGNSLLLGGPAQGGASLFYGGVLDEVALYNTPLSQARITAHYTAASA